MATIDELITQTENELQNVLKYQSVQSEDYKLVKARLDFLMKTRKELQIESLDSSTPIRNRTRFVVPRRGETE